MKNLILLLYIITTLISIGQTPDRYNFVQKQTDSSVLIAWRTSVPGVGNLEWGTDAASLTNVMSNPVATDKHAYEIFGLQPDTKYYYRTSTNNGFTSAVDHFFTAKSSNNSHFTFLHYGDCGYNNSVQNTIAALMFQEKADFGIVAGDVDQSIGNNYDVLYFNVYKDILKNYCHFPAIGNHDTYYDDAATYLDAFYLPTNNPQQSERYYSFIWGNAKFICMDSNIPYTPGSDQYTWLIDELKCNNEQWLFVFFHHPPWTNAWSADYYIPFTDYFLYQGNVDMRTELVPLFEQYGVDFVLNGHSHCYQRGQLNGVKYIISGGAGSSTIDFNTNSNSPNIDTEIYTNQYVRFNIDTDTATYVCIDASGNVIDSVFTEKQNWNPIITTISAANGVLSVPNGSSFQWYLDENQISGATSSSFTPGINGNYQVEIFNQHGCSVMSETYPLFNLGLDEWTKGIKIYPNPASEIFYIENNSDQTGVAELRDMFGKKISTIQMNSQSKIQLDVRDISRGVYFIHLSTSLGDHVERIVIH
jgi:predicted phosphodiesterase